MLQIVIYKKNQFLGRIYIPANPSSYYFPPVLSAPVGVSAVLPGVELPQLPSLPGPVLPPFPTPTAPLPAALPRLEHHGWAVKDHSEPRVLTAATSRAARTSWGCGRCWPLMPIYQPCNRPGRRRRGTHLNKVSQFCLHGQRELSPLRMLRCLNQKCKSANCHIHP